MWPEYPWSCRPRQSGKVQLHCRIDHDQQMKDDEDLDDEAGDDHVPPNAGICDGVLAIPVENLIYPKSLLPQTTTRREFKVTG